MEISFEGVRHKDGYVIRDDVLKPRNESPVEHYDPRAGLYLEFASIPLTEEGILEFANRFGLLFRPGVRHTILNARIAKAGPAIEPETSFQGRGEETVAHWRGIIGEMNDALQVLSFSRSKDTSVEALFTDRALAKLEQNTMLSWSGSRSIDAFVRIQKLLKEKLASFRFVLSVSVKNGLTFRSYLEAPDLETLLWVQLAQALGGDRTFRRCEICGKWLEIAREGSGRRPAARTCSGNCRVKLHNRFKRRARELRAGGSSWKKFVTELRGMGWQPALVRGRHPTQTQMIAQIKKWVNEAR